MANDSLLDHEYDGIREYDNPCPGWWHLIFWATVVFSAAYFLYYHLGPPDRTLADSYQASLAANLKLRFAELGELKGDEATLLTYMKKPEWLAVGESVYKTNCQSCHAADGSGSVGPNLTDDSYKNAEKLADLVRVVESGAASGSMPSWKNRLHVNEVVLVAAYVANMRGKNLSGPRGAEGKKIPPWPTAPAGASAAAGAAK